MTRVKISAAIILLLIGLSVFSSSWVNSRCDVMIAQLAEMREMTDKGEDARAFAQRINSQWEDFRGKASVLIKYDKIVEIDRLCSRIGELAEKDNAEFVAEISELCDMLEMLKSGETPLLTSVL